MLSHWEEPACSVKHAKFWSRMGFDILSTLRSFPRGTAAGPSGLRIQHLPDAAIPLSTPICATLRDIVNLFASGKAPPMVARFLTGGTLNELKDGSPPDLRPIAVGESLRRLTGKCICTLVKDKASDLFQPLQLGVACSSGSEKIIHGLRKSIEDHWMEEDFVVFKIDIQNAFNLVSIQAVLDECDTSFPELLPWVTWCYGDYLYCSKFIAGKCADARKLLPSLVDVAAVDPHVALSLLRLCGSYCRLVHLARATPSSLAGSLKLFDEEVRSNADNVHLQQAIIQFNDQVSTSDAITAEAKALDPLGYHATTCTHGGDVVTRHNLLLDVVANLFRQAHMGVTVEAGYGLTHDNSRSCLADVLLEAAVAAESRKHVANDPNCFELGWTCVPLAVETYGNWGVEAQETFSRLASLLAASHSVSKSKATADIYGRSNLTLTRSVAGLSWPGV
eukprot:Em0024g330a